MSILLAFVQLAAIGFVCTDEVQRKSPAMFLWATLMIMFGIPHFIEVLLGNSTFGNDVLNQASLFVVLFVFFYYVTRLILASTMRTSTMNAAKKIIDEVPGDEIDKWYVLVLAVTCLLMLIPMIRFSGGLLNTSWTSGREASAEHGLFSDRQLLTTAYFVLGGTLCLATLQRRWRVFAVVMLLLSAVVLLTRNRIFVLPLLISLILPALLRTKHVGCSTVVYATIALISVIFIVYGLRAFRYYGTLGGFIQNATPEALIGRIFTFLRESDGELGLRQWFYYFIDHNNQFEGFGSLATYRRMILVLVPTQLSFGLKPQDFAQTMGTAIGMSAGGSMHPTLFGDCYANAGFMGVMLGALWAMIVTLFDAYYVHLKSSTYRVLCLVLLGSMYCIIARGAVYNGFFIMVIGLIEISLISALFSRNKGLTRREYA